MMISPICFCPAIVLIVRFSDDGGAAPYLRALLPVPRLAIPVMMVTTSVIANAIHGDGDGSGDERCARAAGIKVMPVPQKF
jgi:hypothetical protein